MADDSKGRTADTDNLLTTEEAARMLGVPLQLFRRLRRKKLVKSVKTTGPQCYFHPADIMAMQPLLDDRRDLAGVEEMALQAYAMASRVERQMKDWAELQGPTLPRLSTTRPAVLSLQLLVKQELKADHSSFPAEHVIEWARTFLAVDEEQLVLAAYFTGEYEPWRPMLELADRMVSAAPRHVFHSCKDLQVAYGYLEVARKNLRQVAYFFCRKEYGPSIADRLFTEPHSEISRIVYSLLYPS